MARFDGWPENARSVVERACDAHGGRDRWQAIGAIGLELRALSGLVPWLKGHARTFRMIGSRFEIEPQQGRVTVADYPAPGTSARFDRGTVAWEGSPGAGDHRAAFRGLRKWRRWGPRDAVYFFGYALAHYHSLPFTLEDATFVRHRARAAGDAITVDLPADLHTHCKRQTFHFDETGVLRRHDYVADIVGAVARGAHFWRDQVREHGILIARTRHVQARLGGVVLPITALHAEVAITAVSLGSTDRTAASAAAVRS